MSIAYAYEHRADDIDFQSGYPYFILDQLKKRARVDKVFPLSQRSRYAFAPKYLFYKLRGRTYHTDREPLLLKSLAAQITRQLDTARSDFLFSPNSSVLSFLDTDLPKVFCADATFANVVDAYDEYSACAAEYVRLAHAQEARALSTCAAAVYPSDFAARSAIEDYGADPQKVHVLPFGANVDVPPRDTVDAAIAGRNLDPLRILFNGRDWKRKGGDIVLRACEIALQHGVRLTLDLVGPDAVPQSLPDFARIHGLLLKSDLSQRRRLATLLAETDLLFMPSRAENYGIALCEAAAYGVPSLSTAVGGIPTIVRADVSGYALPADSPPEAYAAIICECFTHRERYRELCRSTRRFYDEELSWDKFGENLMKIMATVSPMAAEAVAADKVVA
jgi:glycosyltransferase involved in cell wall biosynthesis